MVLLKNDPVEGAGTLLPLTAKAKTVALIGPMADDALDLLGAWTVAGNPKDVITLKSALQERLGDRLLYAPGCGLLSGEDEKILKSVTFTGPAASVDQPLAG